MRPKVTTIGVYGFTEEGFFRSLVEADVDTFCDIRLRRGMRGSAHAFVNSVRLQQRLGQLGIRYRHDKEFAPDAWIRELQKEEDEELGVTKRARVALSRAFIDAYEEKLSRLNPHHFLDSLGPGARVIALFCVEREPEACHRSLMARWLSSQLGLQVEDIRPWQAKPEC